MTTPLASTVATSGEREIQTCAWSTLAVAYAVVPQYGNAAWQASWLASDQAAQRALALNPNDADAYAALSYNQFSQRHYTAMVEPMQRALELAPEDSAVNYWAAYELAALGRTRDAEIRIDAALANDPANPLLLFYKSMARWREGDQVGALDFIHRSGTADSPFGELLQLGEPGRSFDLYEHAHSGLSDAFLNWLWQPEPWSRKARQDVAFQGFAKRLGMVDYWKRYGWPDLCQPAPNIGPDAFTCQ